MRKLDWNRIAERLKMLQALQEAQRIEARNDAECVVGFRRKRRQINFR